MDEIRFTTTLSRDDYRSVAYYNIFGRNILTPILCILIFLGGISILIFQQFLKLHFVFGIIFTLYPLIMIGWQMIRVNGILKRKRPVTDIEQEITINDDGFFIKNEVENQEYDWGFVHEVRENGQFVLIYTTAHRIIYLKKSDMTSEQVDSLKNLIMNKISYKHYKLKF